MIKKIYRKLMYQATNPLDTQIFQRLTRLYVIALLAVALLSLIGQLLIQVFLNSLLDDSHVVNIAGRQRMLSQRLSKTAVLLCRPDIFQADAEHYSQDIKEIIALWEVSHKGLKNKNLETDGIKYTVRNSAKIDSMFREIDPIFNVILTNAKNIDHTINTPIKAQQEVLQKSLNQILTNERTFLMMMNKIVFQYDLESRERVDTTKKIELILFILLFSILVLEGAFIFRPMANNIRLVIKKLTDSESTLRQTNETLLKTQEALVQATEEKYKLQLAEGKIKAASLMEGQENERRRLAADLHDGIGQMLTGLRLHSEKVKSFKFINQKQEKSFDELQKLIQETIETTRTVSFNLAPSVLSDFGLVPAVRILTEQVSKISDIKIELEAQKIARLPEGVETCLYRITQEAIHNAVKYAQASLIKIQIKENQGAILLQIADDGTGFDPRTKKKSLGGSGLKNMQARTELLDGTFKIQSKIGKGTTIKVEIPN
ncbi:MAG: type IV pili methyl-accepting chemotaxis transducer N-terminal domain-containing protein [Arcicella sp.]|jgi:signal transduction histidine kinase|nr:type IV pili methyl-accepting chemotaxis transducer N-terminal domain-containing protein [Arcicella sp.]